MKGDLAMNETTLVTIPMRPDRITLETEVGRVVVSATIEHIEDSFAAERGQLDPQNVRKVEVNDALIDTGCTVLGLPKRFIQQLQLRPVYKRPIRSATGLGETTVYAAVRLTIQDRSCSTDVFEIPDELPVLVGQVPLEQLDFVVDPKSQKLIGNPEHGGEWIVDMF
jgi:predicted aspartyl protease